MTEVAGSALRDWPIEVLTKDEWHAWRAGVRGYSAQLAKVTERGKMPINFGAYESGKQWFQWMCPGCGRCSFGEISDAPVSGWSNPQWIVEGLPDQLTMLPSFGCPNWRDGTCVGHWWVRDGKLVPA